jgi:hypothetical protein
MQVLIARAGLTLNPGQVADLVLAWRQIVGLLGLIPLDRPLLDDQAFVFRLPPPATAAKPAAVPRLPPSAPRPGTTAPPASKKSAARPGKKASAGKKAPAGKRAQATKKPPAAKKSAARKPVRRRR